MDDGTYVKMKNGLRNIARSLVFYAVVAEKVTDHEMLKAGHF